MLRPDSASAPTTPTGPHLPADVLRRYVAGTLAPAEQHRVEAHTLDCPYCADILEGLEMQSAAVTDVSLLDLRQRLGARVGELAAEAEPVAPAAGQWRKLAVAAALLLSLGVVAWLSLYRTKLTGTEGLATRQPTLETPVTSAPPAALPLDTSLLASASSFSDKDAALAPPPAPTAASPVAVQPMRVPRESALRGAARSKAGEMADGADKSAADLAALAPDSSRPAAAPVAVAAAPAASAPNLASSQAKQAQEGAARAKLSEAATAVAPIEPVRTVRGRITDQRTGEGLPGVTVLVPGTQQGVSTAADGSFALRVPASVKQLSVSSMGYATATHSLRPNDSTLALALAADTKQLSEVVVVRRTATPAPAPVSAMPAGGYARFKQYLRDSLDYPEKALEARLEGNVKLRFVVGVDGKLSDMKVVKKLSEECDAEAIRLLQQGPAWFPAIQNGRRVARTVEVTVPFKIE